jgi:hypothetical protein
MAKKRSHQYTYTPEFLKYGFTEIQECMGISLGQCMEGLANSSLKKKKD